MLEFAGLWCLPPRMPYLVVYGIFSSAVGFFSRNSSCAGCRGGIPGCNALRTGTIIFKAVRDESPVGCGKSIAARLVNAIPAADC